MSRTIDPKLLEILICPLTKSPLRYDAERDELISDKARLAYPIRDGIPIMLPDEARTLDEGEVSGAPLPGATAPGISTEGGVTGGGGA
jgi:uncharacterized protein